MPQLPWLLCVLLVLHGLLAGLRQLREEERLHTLEVLEANRAEVEARLAALPIIIETPSQVWNSLYCFARVEVRTSYSTIALLTELNLGWLKGKVLQMAH